MRLKKYLKSLKNSCFARRATLETFRRFSTSLMGLKRYFKSLKKCSNAWCATLETFRRFDIRDDVSRVAHQAIEVEYLAYL